MYVCSIFVLFLVLANGFRSSFKKIHTHSFQASTYFKEPYDDFYHSNSDLFQPSLPEEPLYIVIWKDCKDCQELLYNMKQQNINHFYLNTDNAAYYALESVDLNGEDAADHLMNNQNEQSAQWVWKELINHSDQIDVPLFYKNEKYLGNNLMDIYSELFPI